MKNYCFYSLLQCKEWRDSMEPFGCEAKLISPELKTLCKNVTINAGGNYPPLIVVFKGGKLYKFNNRPKPNKPFGDLVEGPVPAKSKYPGIHPPGAVGHNENNFLIVYRKHWSQWLPNGFNDILDEPIITKEFEIPDQLETDLEDAGALIPTNETNPKQPEYAKILGNKVCYVVIKKNKLYWKDSDNKCRVVTEDKNNFPPYIVAAIKPKDNNWYFFRRDGKYCKRADKNYKEV